MLRLIYGFFCRQLQNKRKHKVTQSVLNLQSVPAQYDWLEEEPTRVRLELESDLFSFYSFFDSREYNTIIIQAKTSEASIVLYYATLCSYILLLRTIY